MSDRRTVAVAGGGVAGLSVAVFLAEKGFQVHLFESSPKLGGRAFSFSDRESGMFFDNGQHLLAGWYRNTFEFLKLTGSFGRLRFQKKLSLDFITGDGSVLRLGSRVPGARLNLLAALAGFRGFTFGEKVSIARLEKLASSKGSGFENAEELLQSYGQTGNLRKYFWDPFIYAVFNTSAENVSAEALTNLLRTAMDDRDGFTLVIPECSLNELLVDPALNYLSAKNCTVSSGRRLSLRWEGDKARCFEDQEGNEIFADYFVSAVPFYSFDALAGGLMSQRASEIKASCIISVHIFLNEDLSEDSLPGNELGMTGLVDSVPQWIFRKSGKYISLVISGADISGLTETDAKDIEDICIADLEKRIKNFRRGMVGRCKVIKEKRATFIPDRTCMKLRFTQRTALENFFIAGDWTDTGLPSTIESSVKSARLCADHICGSEK